MSEITFCLVIGLQRTLSLEIFLGQATSTALGLLLLKLTDGLLMWLSCLRVSEWQLFFSQWSVHQTDGTQMYVFKCYFCMCARLVSCLDI